MRKIKYKINKLQLGNLFPKNLKYILLYLFKKTILIEKEIKEKISCKNLELEKTTIPLKTETNMAMYGTVRLTGDSDEIHIGQEYPRQSLYTIIKNQEDRHSFKISGYVKFIDPNQDGYLKVFIKGTTEVFLDNIILKGVGQEYKYFDFEHASISNGIASNNIDELDIIVKALPISGQNTPNINLTADNILFRLKVIHTNVPNPVLSDVKLICKEIQSQYYDLDGYLGEL